MYILEVILLTPLPPNTPQILSYFHDEALATGALTEVSMGKRVIKAVVVACNSLADAKIAVKKSTFQLKKITRVISNATLVTSRQFDLTEWLARTYYAPLGASLKTVLPPFWGIKKYEKILIQNNPRLDLATKEVPPQFIIQNIRDEVKSFRIIIVKALKDKKQALILVPDQVIAKGLVQELSDLEPQLVHAGLSNPEYASLWQSVQKGVTKLIIGTRVGLFLPYQNLGAVIVENYLHDAYKSESAPRYRTPDLARHVTQIHSASIFFTSPIIGIEELPLANISSNPDYAKFRRTTKFSNIVEVIDSIEEIKTGNFSLLSRSLQSAIVKSVDAEEPILLYSPRRGYAGLLICENCGAMAQCPNCKIPQRVHVTSENLLICYRCSAYRELPKNCPNCHSHKLKKTGVPGSQKIKEDIAKLLERHDISKSDVFIFDSDLLTNQEQEDELLAEIKKSPAPIVIATQLFLSYRKQFSFPLIGVVRADALALGVDFRADERTALQLAWLQDFEPNKMIIQTHQPDNSAVTACTNNNFDHWHKEELEARKVFGYPPFTRLAHLTYTHANRSKTDLAGRTLSETLRTAIMRAKFEPVFQVMGPFYSIISPGKGQSTVNIVLKAPSEFKQWSEILRYAPSIWRIDIDPVFIA